MRKNLLAKSIAVMIGGLGLATAAHAVVDVDPFAPYAAATVLEVNTADIGHMLVVPYYSVQNNNNTLVNIVNTDTLMGKAVKVRFRSARNSDDVYDFTVLMSPGDVWSAALSATAAGGAKLSTQDKSCTLPASVNGDFVAARLPGADVTGTAEGYVEIFVMADIPPLTPGTAVANPLYTAIKHVNGVPPCTAGPLNALFTDPANGAAANAVGLGGATTGLTAAWTIINVPNAASWTGNATAVEARRAIAGYPGVANIVYSPQSSTPVPLANARLWTADPLLRGGVADNTLGVGAPGAAGVAAAQYDFPDMSTPYLNSGVAVLANGVGARQQASGLTASLATSSVANEYITVTGLKAATDWIFSMPTRRYNVARNYAGAGSTVFTNLIVDDANAAVANTNNYFTPANTTLDASFPNTICVTGLSTAAGANAPIPNNYVTGATVDQEEAALGSSSQYVVSPGVPNAPVSFCGEVSILSFNAPSPAKSVLGGVLTRKDMTVPYVAGWMRIFTPGLVPTNAAAAGNLGGDGRTGLPILGASVTQLTNSNAAPGVSGNYGNTFQHKFTRY